MSGICRAYSRGTYRAYSRGWNQSQGTRGASNSSAVNQLVTGLTDGPRPRRSLLDIELTAFRGEFTRGKGLPYEGLNVRVEPYPPLMEGRASPASGRFDGRGPLRKARTKSGHELANLTVLQHLRT
eukprot:644599-Pyramimonas_sp.AAC.1